MNPLMTLLMIMKFSGQGENSNKLVDFYEPVAENNESSNDTPDDDEVLRTRREF